MAGKLPPNPVDLPATTDDAESTLIGGASPFTPAPPVPSRPPVPTYGRPIQFRQASPAAAAAATSESHQPDSTVRGQPAFTEPQPPAPMEESNQTVMQLSPFVPAPQLPNQDFSVEPTAVKGVGPIAPAAAPAPAIPKRATGARAAIDLPDPAPAVEESNSTLIFDSRRHAAPAAPAAPAVEESNSTLIFDSRRHAPAAPAAPPAAEADSEVTGEASGVTGGEPTQDPAARREVRKSVSRPAPGGAQDKPEPIEHTVNIAATKDGVVPGRVAGPQAMILLVMGTIALALGATLLKGDSKPSTNDLRALYPYGIGGRQPNGRTAPSALEVEFKFEKQLECHGQMCSLYQAEGVQGGFEVDMLVYKDNGAWTLDSSYGMSAH